MRYVMVFLLLLAIGIWSPWSGYTETPGQNQLEGAEILAKIKSNEAAIASARGYFTDIQFLAEPVWRNMYAPPFVPAEGSDRDGVLASVRHVLIAFSGGKFRCDEREVHPRFSSGMTPYLKSAFDGQKAYKETSDGYGLISSKWDRGFASDLIAYTLNIPWGDRRMLSDRMKALNMVLKGEERVNGLTCYRFEVLKDGYRETVWIAPSRGFTMARHYQGGGMWHSEMLVKSWRKYGDVWVPYATEIHSYHHEGNEQYWIHTELIRTESFSVNTTIPDHVFHGNSLSVSTSTTS